MHCMPSHDGEYYEASYTRTSTGEYHVELVEAEITNKVLRRI